MFSSLRAWLTLSVKLAKYKQRKPTGTVVYEDPVDVPCAMEQKIIKVINRHGEEVKSHIQVYTETDNITVDDMIILDDTKYLIKAVHKYYDFNTGDFSINVVYL